MIEAGSKKRNQPAPPHVIVEALAQPDRDPLRPWLFLLDDERPPIVIAVTMPSQVVWGGLWLNRPDAIVRFDIEPGGGGSDVRWTLLLEEPLPAAELLKHMRHRMGELINRDLRDTFDH